MCKHPVRRDELTGHGRGHEALELVTAQRRPFVLRALTEKVRKVAPADASDLLDRAQGLVLRRRGGKVLAAWATTDRRALMPRTEYHRVV